MIKVRYTNQFKRDYKLIKKKRGYAIENDKVTLTISRKGSHSDLF